MEKQPLAVSENFQSEKNVDYWFQYNRRFALEDTTN